MKKKFFTFLFTVLFFLPLAFGKANFLTQHDFIQLKKIDELDSQNQRALEARVLASPSKSLPILLNLMKSEDATLQSKWKGLFWIGQLAGLEAEDYISKFAYHKDWNLRVAALKVLLALKSKKNISIYKDLIKDPSMIVRYQCLENLKLLKIKSLKEEVWSMMFDEQNYVKVDGKLKRGIIFQDILKTLAVIDQERTQKFIKKILSSNEYKDLRMTAMKSLALISST